MKQMGLIARSDKQLTLIYSSNTRVGKHTLSYLTGIQDRYLAIDLVHTKIPGSQWVEIAESLNVKVGDLIDQRKLGFKGESIRDYNTEDWIKIIQNNDDAISKPIAIKNNVVKQISNPTEILEFFDVDSAGLKQGPSLEDRRIDIDKTSDGEKFIDPK